MKTLTKYQEAKKQLKDVALFAKNKYPKDKPAQRQVINDNAYFICRDLNLSEYQSDLLHNYACKLHPKK